MRRGGGRPGRRPETVPDRVASDCCQEHAATFGDGSQASPRFTRLWARVGHPKLSPPPEPRPRFVFLSPAAPRPGAVDLWKGSLGLRGRISGRLGLGTMPARVRLRRGCRNDRVVGPLQEPLERRTSIPPLAFPPLTPVVISRRPCRRRGHRVVGEGYCCRPVAAVGSALRGRHARRCRGEGG